MAVDPKLNNAAVLAQRAYNNAVTSLAASQQAIATITARGGTATAAQTAALTAAQNAVTASSTAVKSAQMALNAANNGVAVAAGTTGKAVSPAVDPGAKQQQPYNVQTTTGTGPILSSSNGLLNIVGATALAAAAANPLGTARLVGSLFSSAKDILGVGGTTKDTPVNPASNPSQFPAYDDDGNLQPGFAINDETGDTYYRGFELNTDRPVNPASDPSQFPAYDDDGNLQPGFAINDETGDTYYQGFERNTDQPLSVTADPSQFPAYDDDGNLQPGFAINDETGDTYYQGFERNTDTPVNPASDPSQFPAYDDDGNLQPGFAINDETGDTYYQGFERSYDEPVNPEEDPFEQSRYEAELEYDAQEPYDFGAADVNDPYYGLSSSQLEALGGADPTDPYIRARLGIPQLPGSTLLATPGFGTIKTGVPILDTAISSLGSLFGFDNTKTGTTTGSPAPTPDTAATAQEAAALLDQDPGLTDDEDQNLQNIVGAQGEIVRAEENIQSNNRQILANEEAQAAAQEQQRQAQAIIDQNNAELADENLSDDRRAELEANNAAQRASIAENAAVIDEAQNNIDNATANNEQQTDSILTNQGVIEENSEAFSANGSELGAPVVAGDDPALEEPVEDIFVEADETVTELSEEETAALFDGTEEPVEDIFVEADETVTELTEEETAALFDGADQPVEDEFVEVDETVTELSEEETAALFDGTEPVEDEFVEADETVTELSEEETAALFDGTDVDAEIERAAAEGVENFEPDAVDEFDGIDEQVAANENALEEPPQLSPEEVDAEIERAADEGAEQFEPNDVDSETDPALAADDGTTEGIQDQINDQDADASQQNATILKAKEQATLQARYKQPASSDWRVRLQLAPQANYLYKAKPPGILAPLYNTDGVIFPYTPSIETSYTASYDRADLVHSNYRGYFYKNSAVGDINIRGIFTAQDTQEADYLLAVIHFFRSVTKMFYGQDTQRGAPPPLVYLSGLGQYQFNQHPCLVSSFTYSLPTDVDYIRAGAPNNYGTNLLSARSKTNGAQASNAGSAVISRLVSANLNTSNPTLNVPQPNQLTQNVNNLNQATYVPTKIEISLQLLPINTRSQISQQFSVKDFAAGSLIKGGFW